MIQNRTQPLGALGAATVDADVEGVIVKLPAASPTMVLQSTLQFRTLRITPS